MGGCANICGRTDGGTDEHDEVNRGFRDYKSAPESDTDFLSVKYGPFFRNINLLV